MRDIKFYIGSIIPLQILLLNISSMIFNCEIQIDRGLIISKFRLTVLFKAMLSNWKTNLHFKCIIEKLVCFCDINKINQFSVRIFLCAKKYPAKITFFMNNILILMNKTTTKWPWSVSVIETWKSCFSQGNYSSNNGMIILLDPDFW